MNASVRVNAETRQKYRDIVDDIILSRVRILIPIGLTLHLAFSYLDFKIYPSLSWTFLNIRLFDSAVLLIFYALTFIRRMKPHIVWLGHISVILASLAMCVMIYLSDGAASHYYEGLNLTILVLLIFNGFYYLHNLFVCLVVLLVYAAATAMNTGSWSLNKFLYAFYFVSSTSFFVVLMTKFYSDQHLNGFLINEALRESEVKLEALYKNAEEISKTDDLTKLFNRRHFFEILRQKMKASDASGLPFYLIIFDIDNFKPINDKHGHVFGDQVLLRVAQVVSNNIRPNSHLGRYGGDEFMMIFDKATKEEILKRVQGISYAIRGIPLTTDNQQPLIVSASFGVARYEPGQGLSETSLIEAADRELLNVKQTKRGEISLEGDL